MKASTGMRSECFGLHSRPNVQYHEHLVVMQSYRARRELLFLSALVAEIKR